MFSLCAILRGRAGSHEGWEKGSWLIEVMGNASEDFFRHPPAFRGRNPANVSLRTGGPLQTGVLENKTPAPLATQGQGLL